MILRTSLVAAIALLTAAAAQAQPPETAPEIALPDVLAVEMPKGMTQIGPADSPLHELLVSAHDGTKQITWDLQHKVGIGPLRVTWRAWNGPVGSGNPAATRTQRVFVFPFGM